MDRNSKSTTAQEGGAKTPQVISNEDALVKAATAVIELLLDVDAALVEEES